MAANPKKSSRLGNDPFAALGMAPADERPAKPKREAQRGAGTSQGTKGAQAGKASAAKTTGKTNKKSTKTTTSGKKPKKAAAKPKRPVSRPTPAKRSPKPAATGKTGGGKPSAATRAAGAPAGPPAAATESPTDWGAMEARLGEALRHLHSLPLPEGPLERSATEEFFELLRGVLRAFSPAFYYRMYNRMVLQERSLSVDPFGLDPVFEEKAEQLADFFYRRWWRVDAEGVDHIPVGGRTLLVANHSGMLPYDGAMIKHAVRVEHPARRTVRFLVENFVFYFPFLGTLVYRYGGVRASQENAQRLLDDEQLTAVFPEGVKGLGKSYRRRYQLQRFGRGGFIKLALRTRSPIVPVAVIGAEEIHPILGHANVLAKPLKVPYVPITPTFPWFGPLGLIPLPTKWRIVFGEPLTFPLEYGPEEADNEILVNELTLRVRRIIHELIYEQLAVRRSVFLG